MEHLSEARVREIVREELDAVMPSLAERVRLVLVERARRLGMSRRTATRKARR